ncbi:methylated-DNA--[protein]-cysteine S-methyltransferase [Bacillus cereus]|uniref:Methylated-DNA--[protein]-cysteine S-methyltransferase n=1 Tax=Bacillus nitratireducens TaxID=2026193 RepID=A0ABU6PBB6_9BACI|nr:methylated-DNA--[protein]-cysteine S-methyltransferase [Bacillus nitratireducens]EJS58649.1 methylated-DNA-[protein]-cysteine S-methyltransferase [Bacillus cereus BAG1X1-3]EOO72818.1 methylated-DNA-[protein]-cysteine S-methyltransferase [Bacillus cereus BAG1O-1]OSX99852.1 Methylated-DNA--protein-cysteine methyltransferase [Bacillus mycoides]PDY21580.1 methylated-DNA--[protein]-cysteine S-methyltransferase [Bacillus cereus]MDR4172094.1 methylated-DNA--[protein]-cysteine S-methyltransferase [
MKPYENKTIYWTLFVHENWRMHIAATSNGLCFIGSQNDNFEELNTWAKRKLPQHTFIQNPDYLQTYTKELIEYLETKLETFTIPIDVYGTAFQLAVWNTVREIPYGETHSYSEIAEKIQKPNAVRAVGTAIGANPLLITIPCHRVIGKNGKLTGFRGGLEMKKELLKLEALREE